MTVEKNERIAELFEVYGTLLTKKQAQYIQEYYFYDLSLSEIADNHNISRQSVLDGLNQATKKLEDHEKSLKILEKQIKIKNLIKNKELNKDELIKELERII